MSGKVDLLRACEAPRFAWTIVVVPPWPRCRLKPVPLRLVSEFERSSQLLAGERDRKSVV